MCALSPAQLWTVMILVLIVASIANYSLQTYEDCRTIKSSKSRTEDFARKNLWRNQSDLNNVSRWYGCYPLSRPSCSLSFRLCVSARTLLCTVM